MLSLMTKKIQIPQNMTIRTSALFGHEMLAIITEFLALVLVIGINWKSLKLNSISVSDFQILTDFSFGGFPKS